MIIVGIDPGTLHTGFAVIEVGGRQPLIKDLGAWHFSATDALGTRLENLHTHATTLFSRWNPQRIGLEKALVFKNVASAMKLSEARGVIRLAAHQILRNAELRISELSPTAVKRQASGLGLAAKKDVQRMLTLRFQGLAAWIERGDLSADAFDALAVAWTTWVLDKRLLSGEAKSHEL